MQETVIVGAGLAGALAGWTLSRQQAVILVEAGQPGDGASGVAAGLAHTFMARRANPIAYREEAWHALREAITGTAASSALLDHPVVRPAGDGKQARAFQETAADYPDDTLWWTAAEVAARMPWLHAPEGALCVRQGCAIDVLRLVQHVVAATREQGGEVRVATEVVGWEEQEEYVDVHVRHRASQHTIRATRLILAQGYGWHTFLKQVPLNLHFIKGHTVRVARPASLPMGHHVSGTGYAVIAEDTVTLGSTFEHTFDDLTTDPARIQEVLVKTSRMIPALATARVLDAQAGVRVTVPGTRQPVVGPVTPRGRVWALTGLGSKGLLMGAWLASNLPDWLADPSLIPAQLRPRFTT